QELTSGGLLTLSADGQRLACVDAGGRLRLYDTATGKELRQFYLGGIPWFWFGRFSIAMSPDGKTVAASTLTALRIWDATTGELLKEVQGCCSLIAFSPDGKLLACGDRKAVRLFEVESLKEVRAFEESGDTASALAFSADAKWLAVRQGPR